MGSPYLVIISHILTLGCYVLAITEEDGATTGHIVYLRRKERREESEKNHRGRNDRNAYPRWDVSFHWPVDREQIDPGNKGSFPLPVYLLIVCFHCFSNTHTHALSQLYPQSANVTEG